MRKMMGILLSFGSCLCVAAQQFVVDMPNKKKVDDFTFNLINILNDAPFNFMHIKGKLISKTDTVHLQSQIYQTKVSLPGAVAARFVQDSTKYVEYFFGEFENAEEAKESLDNLTGKISKSLNKRVVMLTNDWGNDNNTVKENKLAYTFHNGFFHYNISIQVNKVLARDKWRLVLQVFNGRPNYYTWIMKNEPIANFNFIKSIKSGLEVIGQTHTIAKTCPIELPTLTCAGTAIVNDTSYINYIKNGFDGLPNARSEYDAFFGNMRAGLGSEYVYFMMNVKPPCLRKIAFIKFDDIDKSKRKTIYVSLNEKPPAPNANPLKKEYEMRLSFGY